MSEKTKLQPSDWEILFPSQPYKLGNTILYIEPLSLVNLNNIIKHLTLVYERVLEEHPSFDKNSNVEELNIDWSIVATVVLEETPEVLSELSGLDVSDVKRLPVAVALDLLNKCFEINLESKEDLMGNLQGLGKKVMSLLNGPDNTITDSSQEQ